MWRSRSPSWGRGEWVTAFGGKLVQRPVSSIDLFQINLPAACCCSWLTFLFRPDPWGGVAFVSQHMTCFVSCVSSIYRSRLSVFGLSILRSSSDSRANTCSVLEASRPSQFQPSPAQPSINLQHGALLLLSMHGKLTSPKSSRRNESKTNK